MTPGGVSFSGGLHALYSANLHLRTASRIIMRLGQFPASAFHELERRASRIPWELAIPPGAAVDVRATSRKSRLYHSDAVAERVLTAIDRRVGGIAPTTGQPGGDSGGEQGQTLAQARPGESQLVVVRIDHDRVTISADASGALLHLRGYRLAVARAPLRETLAAALLLASEWDAGSPLVDPMCGSGTIAIEAAMMARGIPPGLERRFAFERWPGFDASLWRAMVEGARERITVRAPAPILASDRDAGAIEATADNARRAGVLDDLTIERRSLSAAEPPSSGSHAAGGIGWIVTNPPYGVRVGERAPLRDLYARLGQVARRRFPGWTLAILSADPVLERQLGLALDVCLRTTNGGIPVHVARGRIPT